MFRGKVKQLSKSKLFLNLIRINECTSFNFSLILKWFLLHFTITPIIYLSHIHPGTEFIIPLILTFHTLLFWGSCIPKDVALQISVSTMDSEYPTVHHPDMEVDPAHSKYATNIKTLLQTWSKCWLQLTLNNEQIEATFLKRDDISECKTQARCWRDTSDGLMLLALKDFSSGWNCAAVEIETR